MKGDVESIAGFLNLKRFGNEFKGPCPLCGGRDRFHLLRGTTQDVVVHCRHGCDFRQLKQFLEENRLIEKPKSRPIELDSKQNEIAHIKALQQMLDRGIPINSSSKAKARRSILRVTGMTAEDVITAFIYWNVGLGGLHKPETWGDGDDWEQNLNAWYTSGKIAKKYEWTLGVCWWAESQNLLMESRKKLSEAPDRSDH